MFDMPLDYLSCFAVVLRKIHGNNDICHTDYSIHSKLEFYHCSEVTYEGATFMITNG